LQRREMLVTGAAAFVPATLPRQRLTASAPPSSREGFAEVPGGRVWWRAVGSGSRTPLLLLHGGPGAGHDYLKPLGSLADDRPVIFSINLAAAAPVSLTTLRCGLSVALSRRSTLFEGTAARAGGAVRAFPGWMARSGIYASERRREERGKARPSVYVRQCRRVRGGRPAPAGGAAGRHGCAAPAAGGRGRTGQSRICKDRRGILRSAYRACRPAAGLPNADLSKIWVHRGPIL